MSDVYETLYYEGEIERLEAELAEANAKIEAVRRFHITLSLAAQLAARVGEQTTANSLHALATDLVAALSPQGSLAGSPIQAKDDQC